MTGHDGYLAIPLWDGQKWVPTDMSGQRPDIDWIDGFDPMSLAPPRYHLGQRIRFKWSYGEILEGEVRKIHRHGGAYYNWDVPKDTGLLGLAIQRYAKMTYTVYARGHGRWVYPEQIIGAV